MLYKEGRRALDISKHYPLAEFTKSATAEKKGLSNIPSYACIVNLTTLCLNVIEPLFDHYGRKARINSGYRSYELNKAIGGANKSQHTRGQAADIEMDNISNQELYDYIKNNLLFDQLILESHHKEVPSSGWVHVSYNTVRNRNDAR